MATYTYDTLPVAERAALPADTDLMSALEAPVGVGGHQVTLTDYLATLEPMQT